MSLSRDSARDSGRNSARDDVCTGVIPGRMPSGPTTPSPAASEDPAEAPWWQTRPQPATDHVREAAHYRPSSALWTALDTAVALGAPLLVTGEPGSGKTQLAYFAAWRLGLRGPERFQVRSTSVARELLYEFDAVSWFHAVHVAAQAGTTAPEKRGFVQPGPLWRAGLGDRPAVVLIDEVDKAPRDFPNDLLFELEHLEIQVTELPDDPPVRFEDSLRPVVIVTSNSERRLPDAFLRRCVYHDIVVDDDFLREVAMARKQELGSLSKRLLELALERFFALRALELRKKPSTAELLRWLRLLALWSGTEEVRLRRLQVDPKALPFLEALLKTREDLDEVRTR